jgi:hypothetical protein
MERGRGSDPSGIANQIPPRSLLSAEAARAPTDTCRAVTYPDRPGSIWTDLVPYPVARRPAETERRGKGASGPAPGRVAG